MLIRYHDAKCEFLTLLLRVSENTKRVYMKSILACEQALQVWRAKLAAREHAPLLAIASPIACGSRVTSRDFPKRRACSQA